MINQLLKIVIAVWLLAAFVPVWAQVADSVQTDAVNPLDSLKSLNPADPAELIIAYEQASQSLREINNKLQIGFDVSSIENQYEMVKPRLDIYRRIGEVNLHEVSLSRINDVITIFEGQLKSLEQWQNSLMNIIRQLSDYRIELLRHEKLLTLDRRRLTEDQDQYYAVRFMPLLNEIDSIEQRVENKLHEVLALEYEISEQYVQMHIKLQDLKSFLVVYWDNLLLKDTLSWSVTRSDIQSLAGFGGRISDTSWRIIDFFRVNILETIQLVALFMLFLFLISRIKKAAESLPDKTSDFTPLYKNPVALSFLLTGLWFPAIFPPTTSLMYDFALIVSYAPFLYILHTNLDMKHFRIYLVFIIALFVLKVHSAVFTSPTMAALLILASCLVFIYTVRPNTIRKFYEIRWKWIVVFNWILGLILVAGLVLILFKRVRLGTILIYGAGDTIALALILIYLGNWSDMFMEFMKTRFKNLSSNRERLNEFWAKWSDRLYLFLMILFLIAFLRNFSLFTATRDAISNFLTVDRTLGDLTFTFGGIALFIIVLYASTSISSTIQFFAEDKSYFKNQKKTANIAIIMRFLLVTVGFILALLVSGIPIDRLAIILGALSVGIGFGLQNIVNNLISGVILIFERPIQTGDLVELQQYTGFVKDIGIRSSIIRTYEGAEVIVPNGNLVSQEVINWTLSNRQRRVEVLAGVAYGSDPARVTELLMGVMENHKKILKLPAPLVLFSGMGDSSLNFTLRFWTSDIDHWVQTQSEITTAVYQELNRAGINIPFPQRDLHIKSWEAQMPLKPNKATANNTTRKARSRSKPADQASKKD